MTTVIYHLFFWMVQLTVGCKFYISVNDFHSPASTFSVFLLMKRLLEVSFQKLQKLVQQPRFFSLFFIPLFLKWKWNLRFPHLPRIKDDVANSDKVYIYDGVILRAIVNDFQPWSSFVLFHFYKNSILGFWCGSKYASELIY